MCARLHDRTRSRRRRGRDAGREHRQRLRRDLLDGDPERNRERQGRADQLLLRIRHDPQIRHADAARTRRQPHRRGQGSQALSGLRAVTTYHYRIVAVGPGGANVGADRTFTTPKIPLSLAIVGVPNPVLYGSPFTVEGTLSGTDRTQPPASSCRPTRSPTSAAFRTSATRCSRAPPGASLLPVVGLLENAQLRVATVGTPTVVSPVLVEGVAVRVTFHARSTGRRGFARLFGSVTPAQVGSLVGFQLLKPGHRSSNVGGTVVRAGSRFSRVVRVRRGLYKALVQVGDGAHVSSYSAPVLIR